MGLNPLFCLLFSSHSKWSATEIAVPSVCLSVRLSVYDVRKTGISAQTFPTLSLRGCYVEWVEKYNAVRRTVSFPTTLNDLEGHDIIQHQITRK